MAINLTKGGSINLSKEDPTLTRIRVGLGWDVRESDGVEFDLDASAFMLNSAGQVRDDMDFVFYNNLKSQEGAIQHTGDNRTGEGDGDDEVMLVNLDELPFDVHKIAITVTIHDAEDRNQNFGMVENAFMRVVNEDTGEEIAHYDLAETASEHTGMLFGELVREGPEWSFNAIGNGVSGGLFEFAKAYGVNVG